MDGKKKPPNPGKKTGGRVSDYGKRSNDRRSSNPNRFMDSSNMDSSYVNAYMEFVKQSVRSGSSHGAKEVKKSSTESRSKSPSAGSTPTPVAASGQLSPPTVSTLASPELLLQMAAMPGLFYGAPAMMMNPMMIPGMWPQFQTAEISKKDEGSSQDKAKSSGQKEGNQKKIHSAFPASNIPSLPLMGGLPLGVMGMPGVWPGAAMPAQKQTAKKDPTRSRPDPVSSRSCNKTSAHSKTVTIASPSTSRSEQTSHKLDPSKLTAQVRKSLENRVKSSFKGNSKEKTSLLNKSLDELHVHTPYSVGDKPANISPSTSDSSSKSSLTSPGSEFKPKPKAGKGRKLNMVLERLAKMSGAQAAAKGREESASVMDLSKPIFSKESGPLSNIYPKGKKVVPFGPASGDDDVMPLDLSKKSTSYPTPETNKDIIGKQPERRNRKCPEHETVLDLQVSSTKKQNITKSQDASVNKQNPETKNVMCNKKQSETAAATNKTLIEKDVTKGLELETEIEVLTLVKIPEVNSPSKSKIEGPLDCREESLASKSEYETEKQSDDSDKCHISQEQFKDLKKKVECNRLNPIRRKVLSLIPEVKSPSKSRGGNESLTDPEVQKQADESGKCNISQKQCKVPEKKVESEQKEYVTAECETPNKEKAEKDGIITKPNDQDLEVKASDQEQTKKESSADERNHQENVPKDVLEVKTGAQKDPEVIVIKEDEANVSKDSEPEESEVIYEGCDSPFLTPEHEFQDGSVEINDMLLVDTSFDHDESVVITENDPSPEVIKVKDTIEKKIEDQQGNNIVDLLNSSAGQPEVQAIEEPEDEDERTKAEQDQPLVCSSAQIQNDDTIEVSTADNAMINAITSQKTGKKGKGKKKAAKRKGKSKGSKKQLKPLGESIAPKAAKKESKKANVKSEELLLIYEGPRQTRWQMMLNNYRAKEAEKERLEALEKQQREDDSPVKCEASNIGEPCSEGGSIINADVGIESVNSQKVEECTVGIECNDNVDVPCEDLPQQTEVIQSESIPGSIPSSTTETKRTEITTVVSKKKKPVKRCNKEFSEMKKLERDINSARTKWRIQMKKSKKKTQVKSAKPKVLPLLGTPDAATVAGTEELVIKKELIIEEEPLVTKPSRPKRAAKAKAEVGLSISPPRLTRRQACILLKEFESDLLLKQKAEIQKSSEVTAEPEIKLETENPSESVIQGEAEVPGDKEVQDETESKTEPNPDDTNQQSCPPQETSLPLDDSNIATSVLPKPKKKSPPKRKKTTGKRKVGKKSQKQSKQLVLATHEVPEPNVDLPQEEDNQRTETEDNQRTETENIQRTETENIQRTETEDIQRTETENIQRTETDLVNNSGQTEVTDISAPNSVATTTPKKSPTKKKAGKKSPKSKAKTAISSEALVAPTEEHELSLEDINTLNSENAVQGDQCVGPGDYLNVGKGKKKAAGKRKAAANANKKSKKATPPLLSNPELTQLDNSMLPTEEKTESNLSLSLENPETSTIGEASLTPPFAKKAKTQQIEKNEKSSPSNKETNRSQIFDIDCAKDNLDHISQEGPDEDSTRCEGAIDMPEAIDSAENVNTLNTSVNEDNLRQNQDQGVLQQGIDSNICDGKRKVPAKKQKSKLNEVHPENSNVLEEATVGVSGKKKPKKTRQKKTKASVIGNITEDTADGNQNISETNSENALNSQEQLASSSNSDTQVMGEDGLGDPSSKNDLATGDNSLINQLQKNSKTFLKNLLDPSTETISSQSSNISTQTTTSTTDMRPAMFTGFPCVPPASSAATAIPENHPGGNFNGNYSDAAQAAAQTHPMNSCWPGQGPRDADSRMAGENLEAALVNQIQQAGSMLEALNCPLQIGDESKSIGELLDDIEKDGSGPTAPNEMQMQPQQNAPFHPFNYYSNSEGVMNQNYSATGTYGPRYPYPNQAGYPNANWTNNSNYQNQTYQSCYPNQNYNNSEQHSIQNTEMHAKSSNVAHAHPSRMHGPVTSQANEGKTFGPRNNLFWYRPGFYSPKKALSPGDINQRRVSPDKPAQAITNSPPMPVSTHSIATPESSMVSSSATTGTVDGSTSIENDDQKKLRPIGANSIEKLYSVVASAFPRTVTDAPTTNVGTSQVESQKAQVPSTEMTDNADTHSSPSAMTDVTPSGSVLNTNVQPSAGNVSMQPSQQTLNVSELTAQHGSEPEQVNSTVQVQSKESKESAQNEPNVHGKTGINNNGNTIELPNNEEVIDKDSLLDRLSKNASEIASCSCPVEPFDEMKDGPYYTHLGAGNSLASIRSKLEGRTGFSGKEIRMEKVIYSGKEGKGAQGCPIAKWVIRRSGPEEKLLCICRPRPGHICESAIIVINLVVWEGVPESRATHLYDYLVRTVATSGYETERRCGTNEQRTCACQGWDGETSGASFSFGCSWSMYYNGCKYARSGVPRKFKLKEESEEPVLESHMQNLVTDLSPLYQTVAPASFKNMTYYESSSDACRLGLRPGRPFAGVTACMDFCAHAHKDLHNMNNGCTMVVTLTKHRGFGRPDDEQLHVLPLYILDPTDENGSTEAVQQKVLSGALDCLTKYQQKLRVRGTPLLSKKKRDAIKRGKTVTPKKRKKSMPGPDSPQSPIVPSSPGSGGATPELVPPAGRGVKKPRGRGRGRGRGRSRLSDKFEPEVGRKVWGAAAVEASEDRVQMVEQIKIMGGMMPSPTGVNPYDVNEWQPNQQYPTGYKSPNVTNNYTGNSSAQNQPQCQGANNESKPSHQNVTNSETNRQHSNTPGTQDVSGNNVQNQDPENGGSVQQQQQHNQTNTNSSLPLNQQIVHKSSLSPKIENPPSRPSSASSSNNPHSISNDTTINQNSPAPLKTESDIKNIQPQNTPGTHPQTPTYPGQQSNQPTIHNQQGLPIQGQMNYQMNQTMYNPGAQMNIQNPNQSSPYPQQQLNFSAQGVGNNLGISGIGANSSSDEKEMMTDNSHLFEDPKVGGVALALGHGSVLFECAKRELHATTAIRNPNRYEPTRISLVFYQHKNLNHPNHGYEEYLKKAEVWKERREARNALKLSQEMDGMLDVELGPGITPINKTELETEKDEKVPNNWPSKLESKKPKTPGPVTKGVEFGQPQGYGPRPPYSQQSEQGYGNGQGLAGMAQYYRGQPREQNQQHPRFPQGQGYSGYHPYYRNQRQWQYPGNQYNYQQQQQNIQQNPKDPSVGNNPMTARQPLTSMPSPSGSPMPQQYQHGQGQAMPNQQQIQTQPMQSQQQKTTQQMQSQQQPQAQQLQSQQQPRAQQQPQTQQIQSQTQQMQSQTQQMQSQQQPQTQQMQSQQQAHQQAMFYRSQSNIRPQGQCSPNVQQQKQQQSQQQKQQIPVHQQHQKNQYYKDQGTIGPKGQCSPNIQHHQQQQQPHSQQQQQQGPNPCYKGQSILGPRTSPHIQMQQQHQQQNQQQNQNQFYKGQGNMGPPSSPHLQMQPQQQQFYQSQNNLVPQRQQSPNVQQQQRPPQPGQHSLFQQHNVQGQIHSQQYPQQNNQQPKPTEVQPKAGGSVQQKTQNIQPHGQMYPGQHQLQQQQQQQQQQNQQQQMTQQMQQKASMYPGQQQTHPQMYSRTQQQSQPQQSQQQQQQSQQQQRPQPGPQQMYPGSQPGHQPYPMYQSQGNGNPNKEQMQQFGQDRNPMQEATASSSNFNETGPASQQGPNPPHSDYGNYPWDASHNYAESGTTQTMTTKWIKPQSVTIGPYQRW